MKDGLFKVRCVLLVRGGGGQARHCNVQRHARAGDDGAGGLKQLTAQAAGELHVGAARGQQLPAPSRTSATSWPRFTAQRLPPPPAAPGAVPVVPVVAPGRHHHHRRLTLYRCRTPQRPTVWRKAAPCLGTDSCPPPARWSPSHRVCAHGHVVVSHVASTGLGRLIVRSILTRTKDVRLS